MQSIFFEITLALILAGAIAVIVSFFKQPSILAYILTGLILGPLGLSKLSEGDSLKGLSEIGVTLLLFMVGLELDVTELKKIGKTASIAGVLQILVTTLLGFTIAKFLGFDSLKSIYLGLALTFSSTIIVVKLLSEKKDLQSLYGKLAVGIFVIQDIVAIFILVFLQGLNSTAGNLPLNFLYTLIKLICLLLIIYLHSKFIFPLVLKTVSKSQELLLVFSLAWALGFAALTALPLVGFNLAIGGFLAGVALANTAVHYEISAKITPLRDFFIMLFFIVLGSQLVFSGWQNVVIPSIAFSTFVLIGNPIIVLVILALLGFKPRTAFFTGFTVGQISEFSLILASLGLSLNHITQNELSIITFTGIATIAVSSYLILHTRQIYEKSKHLISWLDFKKGSAERNLKRSVLRNHFILIGAHRLGSRVIESLSHLKTEFVIIDFNPDIVEKLEAKGYNVICGDITDPYIQDLANIKKAKLIISTLPNMFDTLSLIEAIEATNSKAKFIVTARDEAEALKLYDHQADYVLLPHFIGADHLKQILENKNTNTNLKNLKVRHVKQLADIS